MAQFGVALRCRAGQPVKRAYGHSSRSARAANLDLGVECCECDAHVGWIGRNAMVARAKDRVNAIGAFARRASRARLPLVAGREPDVGEIVAARPLQQVATDGGHVAQLWRRAGDERLREQRVPVTNDGMVGEIAVAHQRADPYPPVGRRLDVVERQVSDVDESRRLLDVALHQVEQVRASGEAARMEVGQRLDG